MRMKLIFVTPLLLSGYLIFGQQIERSPYFNRQLLLSRENVSLVEVLEAAMVDTGDSAVLFKVKQLDIEIPQENFIYADSVLYKFIRARHPEAKLNEQGQLVIRKHLYLDIDSLNVLPLRFEGFDFARGIDFNLQGESNGLEFRSCSFAGTTRFLVLDGLFLTANTFRSGLYIRNERGHIAIEDNTIIAPDLDRPEVPGAFKFYPYAVDVISSPLELFSFTNNKVLAKDSHRNVSSFLIEKVSQFRFNSNELDGVTNLTGLLIERRATVKDNVFKGSVSLYDVIFPENFNKVYWNQFEGQKLCIIRKKLSAQARGFLIYEYSSRGDSLVNEDHKDLIVTYKTLHKLFDDNGDTESANGCYAEKKDVEGVWLKHVYAEQGGFKNYLNFRLNRLLKLYANHGTDPSLAIIISIYVLLIFSVFYFFFPSDWDIASKRRLLDNFNDFRRKNDKGYVKPFFYLVGGLVLSFVNAMTLSINAFITLGFGNIPTRGVARYICIIEGFVGWFLLSIFTVALINQVLS